MGTPAILLTLLATAAAAPADPIYQRLIGEEGPVEASAPLGPELPAAAEVAPAITPATPQASTDALLTEPATVEPSPFSVPSDGPSTGGLTLLALLGLGGAAWYARRRLTARFTPGASRPITVLGRQSLSGTSALVLVAVDDGDGGTRRLLVGTGPGAPNLVADIGGDFTGGLGGLDGLDAAFSGAATSPVSPPAQEVFHPVATTPAPTARPAAARPAAARSEDERTRRSAELQRRAAPIREEGPTPRVVMPAPKAVARAYSSKARAVEPPEPPLEVPRRTASRPAQQRPAPHRAAPPRAAKRPTPARRVSEAEMNRARSLVDEVLSERLQGERQDRRIRGVA